MTESAAIDTSSRRHPVAQGLDAAKANLLPGLGLQGLALAIVLAYYYVPAFQQAMQRLAEFRLDTGIVFGIISTACFGGLIPVLIQQLRPQLREHAKLRHLPFFILLWGIKGIEVDLLYRAQAAVFGDAVSLTAILPKVLVDQMVYVPLWAVPSTVLPYLWKDLGFSFARLRAELGPQWYRHRVLPVMLANWAVWIPAVAIIYCLPMPLQLPLQNLVLCMWSLIIIFMTRQQ